MALKPNLYTYIYELIYHVYHTKESIGIPWSYVEHAAILNSSLANIDS